jgi:hypothetical protein
LCLLYIGIYTTISPAGSVQTPSSEAAGRGGIAMVMLYGICKYNPVLGWHSLTS